MNRAALSTCMALASIAGVLILFNVCSQIPGVLLTVRSGSYDDAFWGAVGADVIGALIGAALVTGAFYIRRHLKALDAKIEGHG